MTEITVSNHGMRRIRKRLGIPRSSAQRVAQNAYENGMHESHMDGKLLQCICYHRTEYGEKKTYVVLPNAMFIYDDFVLVTVVPHRREHQPLIYKLWGDFKTAQLINNSADN